MGGKQKGLAPAWGYLAFLVLVGILASVTNLGYDGIIYVVVLAGACVFGGMVLMRVGKRALEAMLRGEPGALDHLIAPSGYRRSRVVESEQEAARFSVVVPTPNRPLLSSGGTTPVLPTALVEAPLGPQDLDLATGCHPSLDLVVGRSVVLFGMRGSGKSNALARFLEQVFRFPLPALVGDREEDYLTLPAVVKHCVIAGAPDWPGQRHQAVYWKVTPANAERMGYLLLEHGARVILQLSTYRTLEEAAQVMALAIKGMFAWADEQRPEERVAALVVLDEAQYFFPQNAGVSPIKEEAARELLKAFMDVTARGRKRGLTPILATQRPAQVRKEVISGGEIYFLLKQTNPRDLDAYEDLLGKDHVNRQEIATFAAGEALVYEGGECWPIRFHPRQSEHRGKTPSVQQNVARYGTSGRAVPVSFEQEAAQGTSDGSPELAAEEQQETVLPAPKPQGQSDQQDTKRARAKTLDECGIEAWNNGATSGRKLAAALGLKEGAGNQLMNRLLAKGLIQRPDERQEPNE